MEYRNKANGLQILLYDVNMPPKQKEKTHNGKKKKKKKAPIMFSVTFSEIICK